MTAMATATGDTGARGREMNTWRMKDNKAMRQRDDGRTERG